MILKSQELKYAITDVSIISCLSWRREAFLKYITFDECSSKMLFSDGF